MGIDSERVVGATGVINVYIVYHRGEWGQLNARHEHAHSMLERDASESTRNGSDM